jgi:hypothetical protein
MVFCIGGWSHTSGNACDEPLLPLSENVGKRVGGGRAGYDWTGVAEAVQTKGAGEKATTLAEEDAS